MLPSGKGKERVPYEGTKASVSIWTRTTQKIYYISIKLASISCQSAFDSANSCHGISSTVSNEATYFSNTCSHRMHGRPTRLQPWLGSQSNAALAHLSVDIRATRPAHFHLRRLCPIIQYSNPCLCMISSIVLVDLFIYSTQSSCAVLRTQQTLRSMRR